MNPFVYPPPLHSRRHGPIGYADASSYQPWLRDEFCFRCVFCLRREQWDRCIALQVDHFQPLANHPEKHSEYDNLIYACARCNGAKGSQGIDDPTQQLTGDTVIVSTDGTLIGKTDAVQRLIRQLRLDSIEMNYFRRLWIETVTLAMIHNITLYRDLMGFPESLPDLARLRPPGGNSRPNGVDTCYYSQRERGKLPEIY